MELKEQKSTKQAVLWISFVIFIGILAIVGFRIDGDVMWHYKTGEFIVNNSYVTKTDIFSWQTGLNWMCHEWLYDVILYLLYSNFGEIAARFLLIAAYAVPIGFSLLYNRKTIRYPLLYYVFAAFVVSFWASSNCARPSEFSIGIMLLVMWLILENHKYKYPLCFVLSILCTNIHGGSIAQLLVIPILFMISDFVCCITTGENVLDDLKSHALIFSLIAIGSLINPYGVSIYKYTLNIFMGADYVNSHIQEWNPTVINLYMAVFIVGFAMCMGANEKFKSFDKDTIRKFIIICGFMCQGIAILRMYFNASCLILVFGYSYFEDFIEYLIQKITDTLQIKWEVPTFIKNLSESTKELIKGSFLICYAGFAAAVMITNAANAGRGYTFTELVDEYRPEFKEVADYIEENDIGGRIYNEYGDGGLLIIHDIKTFVDPRCDPFLEAFSDNNSLYDYFTAEDARKTTKYEAWKTLNETYEFEYGIFNKNLPASREVASGLRLDGYEVLLENDGYILMDLKK